MQREDRSHTFRHESYLKSVGTGHRKNSAYNWSCDYEHSKFKNFFKSCPEHNTLYLLAPHNKHSINNSVRNFTKIYVKINSCLEFLDFLTCSWFVSYLEGLLHIINIFSKQINCARYKKNSSTIIELTILMNGVVNEMQI